MSEPKPLFRIEADDLRRCVDVHKGRAKLTVAPERITFGSDDGNRRVVSTLPGVFLNETSILLDAGAVRSAVASTSGTVSVSAIGRRLGFFDALGQRLIDARLAIPELLPAPSPHAMVSSRVLRKAARFTARDHRSMADVFVDGSTVVATNSYVMYVCEVPETFPKMRVPAVAASRPDLHRLAEGSAESESEHWTWPHSSDYPDWKKVTRDEFLCRFSFDREFALERIRTIPSLEHSPLRIRFDDGEATIGVETEELSISVRLQGSYEGVPPKNLSLGRDFVIDILETLDGPIVRLDLNDANSVVRFTGGNPAERVFLMPVRA